MEYIRYEYQCDDCIGSFTLKSDADKSIVSKLKAHEVERFTV